MKQVLITLTLVLSLTLVGCGSSTITIVDYTPINNSGAERVAIVQTQNAVIGTVGEHYDGLLAISQHQWVVGSNLASTYPVVITDIIRNELQLAGYDVINMTTTLLTSSMQEDLDLSLGVTITSLHVDTYAPLCGNRSDASVTLRFDVTDLLAGSQVFSNVYVGTASSTGGNDPVSGISMAAQNAVRAFLADELAATTLADI